MIDIIRWNVWEKRWSIVGWSIGISLYAALIILVYASIRDQAQALNGAMNSLSPTAKALFSDSNDLISPVGYLSSKLYYLMLPLLFTVLAISLSNSLFRKEEQNGTLELLLARPLSRTKLFISKLIGAGIIMVLVATVTLLVSLVCAGYVDYGISTVRFILVTLVAVLLSTVFASIAWMLAGASNRLKAHSLSIASFIALGSYLISSLEPVATWLHVPAKFMPYHYYQPSEILHGTYNWWYAAGLSAVTMLFFLIGMIGFRRRDIDS